MFVSSSIGIGSGTMAGEGEDMSGMEWEEIESNRISKDNESNEEDG